MTSIAFGTVLVISTTGMPVTGVGTLVSAFPRLQPHTLALCLVILLILTLINMRGVRGTGSTFLVPTYLFVGTLLAVIAIGTFRTIAAHGHPLPIVTPPRLPVGGAMLSLWVLAKRSEEHTSELQSLR